MGKVINTTSDNLKKYKADQIRKMRYLVVDTVTDIEIEATRKAPVGEDGDHFITIKSEFRNNDLTGEVGVWGENNLAAYFEFGTGLSAREILAPYPEWIRDIAWKFYINGLGTLKGKPYLYPSVLKNTEIFNKKLDEIIKEKTKDNG
ncbi:MAG TPA: hypothetical protein PLG57_05930 [Bacteroidia bacterium]|nr:hypothetical protein [Bacteroidia bacterium]HQF28444.1 hypothetical protein [Bacteroidia bacterium]HQF29239.1 hypothetical protein [Bacteroidia bacterium]